MKQIKKLFTSKIIGLLTLIVFVAVGCNSDPNTQAGPVELTMWVPFADEQVIRDLAQSYEQRNKNVRITVEVPEGEGYEEKLVNSLAADTGPDIYSIHNSALPQYLDKIVEAPVAQWKFVDYRNAFVDTVVSDFTRDNKIYGAVLGVDTLALYYNKAMLPANGIYTVPKTWRELETAARKIAREDTSGYFRQSGVALGLSDNAPGGRVNRAQDILYLFILQQGGAGWSADLASPIFDERVERNGAFVNPAQEALSFYTSFANPLTDNYNWNTRSDYSIDAFANRRAAMMFNYSYVRETLKQKNASLEYDVAPVPQLNLNDPKVNFANYWGQVVSKQSKFQEVAWDFLKFITEKDQLSVYYASSKVPSSRKDLIAEQIADPEIGVFADAAGTAKPFTRPQAKKVDTIFSNTIDSVTLRGVSVEDAIDDALSQTSNLGRTD